MTPESNNMPKDLDYTDLGAYLVSISKRIAALEVDAVEMEDIAAARDEKIVRINEDLKQDLERFSEQVKGIHEGLKELSQQVTEVVKMFNTIARKGSMERLQRKIDDWNPEMLATHKDMRKVLGRVKQ